MHLGKSLLQRRNFWSRNWELKPVYFPVSSCFLPGICSPAVHGIFGRLPRFLPGFSSLSRFLPVLKRGLRSRFVKSGYCFQVSDSEKVTTSSKKKTVTTFSRDQKSRLRVLGPQVRVNIPGLLTETQNSLNMEPIFKNSDSFV